MAKRGTDGIPNVVEETLYHTRTRDDIAEAVAAERAILADHDDDGVEPDSQDRTSEVDDATSREENV